MMGKIVISHYPILLMILSLLSCSRDAAKLPRVRKTHYCFASTNNYSMVLSSNGSYSFHYPADFKSDQLTKLTVLA